MQKLVFLDIDGTLMAVNQTIPRSAADACRAARKNGHILYICSGRQSIEIPAAIHEIGFDGIISAGGARIDAGGKTIFQAFMDISTVTRLVDYFKTSREAFALELFDGKISTPRLWALIESAFRAVRKKTGTNEANEIVNSFSGSVSKKRAHFYRDDVQKIIFVGRKGSFERVQKEFGGECEIFRGSIPILGKESGEISPVGVHKGAALEMAARYHNIPIGDTIAVGDSDNDRTMIERAGTGIAMGNADAELKLLAAYVTARLEDDGIMQAFQKYGLI
jgi:Cof subfamily protein (haloacid dehalogenase superfamily)